MMCGCLVLKPGADRFDAYPNTMIAGDMVISVQPDWADLKDKLGAIFQVMLGATGCRPTLSCCMAAASM